MKTAHTRAELHAELERLRGEGRTIGLVPTMGALHAGHASLVARSVSECGATVVSVFVNPTQFNNSQDLRSYPRSPEADCRLLENLGATIAFLPSVEEMYPIADTRQFSYPPTDSVMEGAKRPGHFNGVCQIVSKLFAAVEPDKAYFGKKDFQQIAVIRRMVADLQFGLEIVACPIVREESGLALSSRNALLTEEERGKAAAIHAALADSIAYGRTHCLTETRNRVVDTVNAVDCLEVEYYEISDACTLEPLTEWPADGRAAVGCIAVYCGKRPVRLIDNVVYQ